MDWVPIVAILATGFFLIPIFGDFQRTKGNITHKIYTIETQIKEIEEAIETDKQQEVQVKAELGEAKKELNRIDEETSELQGVVEKKKK